jgi:hypothetical protein
MLCWGLIFVAAAAAFSASSRFFHAQAVSDVFKVLSQEHAGLRRAAAGLAVQLLEEHGRASVSKAADALKVRGWCWLYLLLVQP